MPNHPAAFRYNQTAAGRAKKPKDYGTGHLLYHSELGFLEAVYRHPGTKASELSAVLGITKGAATQTAARLAEKRFIEIYQQQGNKKEKFYRLTALGDEARQGHERFYEAANQNLCAYFWSLSEEEADTILRFLGHLKECAPFCEFTCKSEHADSERTGQDG